MKKQSSTRRQTVTTYVPVSDNIYHDGSSYRVRVSINGKKYSKNFSNKRKAVTYRNELLGK
jgi:SHS2 domain-containing protein